MNLRVILLLASFPTSLLADNWPGWRGPSGDGICPRQESPPLLDAQKKDLKWKTKIPGIGHASPIIWDDAIFLVSADEGSGERLLLKLDRKTGKSLWEQTVLKLSLIHI